MTTYMPALRHRDTRLQELVGDSVIVRDVDDRGGEIIRQEIQVT